MKRKTTIPPSTRAHQWEDHYTRRARQEQFPARSVYKLQEIQAKFHILRPGQRVLDLGCAPGSWLKYAAGLVGPAGRVTGVDRQAVLIRLPAQVHTVEADIQDPDPPKQALWEGPFDVVLSDMAPSTTGQRDVDAARSLALCEAALRTAARHLAADGHFVCKIFQGPGFDSFTGEVRSIFRQVKIYKPRSTRKASREIYIIGLGRKQED